MAIKSRERMLWGVAQLNIQKNDNVLEIGFGPGTAIETIATIATEGFIAGIEISDVMINQATKRLAANIKQGQVKLELGSVSSLPYGDNTFDKVFAINSLLHWPNPVEDLKEIKRVLKPKGIIAIIQQPRSMKTGLGLEESGEDISAKIKEAGFSNVTIDSKPMKPVTCWCVKGTKP
jgi:ubiquinone/menaquinone biosynthesis C-methylase UbiE